MKKLFMILCVVIMFFGIVGCPSDDQSANMFGQKSFTPVITPPEEPSGGEIPPIGDDPRPPAVPEPATLVLLGSGLVGLAGVGRKKFFKKD